MGVIDRNKVVQAIQTIFRRTPYFQLFFRHNISVAFRFGFECIFIDFDFDKSKVNFSYHKDYHLIHPKIWADIEERDLLEFADGSNNSPHILLESNTGDTHPLIIGLFSLFFRVENPINIREELVYPSLFSFKEYVLFWKSKVKNIGILKYGNCLNGLDAYVTLGLTDEKQKIYKPNEPYNNPYEIILLAESTSDLLAIELVGWVEYIIESGTDILRGEWLEYNEKVIPGTDLSGFLVVKPLSIPDEFPVDNQIYKWNLLLGVTSEELKEAKKSDVYFIAQKLFERGFVDYSPIKRNSVV